MERWFGSSRLQWNTALGLRRMPVVGRNMVSGLPSLELWNVVDSYWGNMEFPVDSSVVCASSVAVQSAACGQVFGQLTARVHHHCLSTGICIYRKILVS